MKPKKEHYRGNLPHYQQPGQWYSVTCSLFGAMPKGAMDKYASRLEIAKGNLKIAKTNQDKDDEINLINNPVSAGLVKNWQDWLGTFLEGHGLSKVRELPLK